MERKRRVPTGYIVTQISRRPRDKKSGVFSPHMNRSLGEGNLDPFFSEALQNPVAKLVLHEILVHEFADLADEGKIQGGFSESGVEPDQRRRIGREYPKIWFTVNSSG